MTHLDNFKPNPASGAPEAEQVAMVGIALAAGSLIQLAPLLASTDPRDTARTQPALQKLAELMAELDALAARPHPEAQSFH